MYHRETKRKTQGASFIVEKELPDIVFAVVENDRKLVKEMLIEEADIDERDKSGRSSLQHAVNLGYIPMIRLLLQSGAFIDAKDDNGETALHHACRRANGVELATILIDEGLSSIETRDKRGITPLMVAADKGNESLVWMLLQRVPRPKSPPQWWLPPNARWRTI